MSFRMIGGDCIEVMAAMEPNSVDAIVTDPPYSLEFMGKTWDRDIDHLTWATEALRVLKPGGHLLAFGGTRTYHRLACAIEDAGFEIRDCLAWMYGSGFPKSLDVSKAIDKKRDDLADIRAVTAFVALNRNGRTNRDIDQAFGFNGMAGHWTTQGPQAAVPTWDQWLELKALLGFGDEMDTEVWRLNGRKGTPGENWDKREVIGPHPSPAKPAVGTFNASFGEAMLTAPATPEAQHWNGWGTALKPAFEPIVLARKPLSERNVAANVLRWGTGALNIDGCRIGVDPSDPLTTATYKGSNPGEGGKTMGGGWANQGDDVPMWGGQGRWPANVTLDETAAAMLDEQSGDSTSRIGTPRSGANGNGWGMTSTGAEYADTGGASRFFYCPKADRAERNNGLAHLEQKPAGIKNDSGRGFSETDPYRDIRAANTHPTVKPIALMAWLCRMVTPKGGTVLDPFTGSGSSGIAALREGFEFIGIEREAEYVEIARDRIIGDAPLFNQEVPA